MKIGHCLHPARSPIAEKIHGPRLNSAVGAVANATPGPTILTLIARVLSIGPARNIGFAIGLVLGDVLWLATAVFGLAALAREAHEIMVVLKDAGAAYLIYLAYKMWTAPVADPMQGAGDRKRHLGSAPGKAANLAADTTLR